LRRSDALARLAQHAVIGLAGLCRAAELGGRVPLIGGVQWVPEYGAAIAARSNVMRHGAGTCSADAQRVYDLLVEAKSRYSTLRAGATLGATFRESERFSL
jgi:hypothetical protein